MVTAIPTWDQFRTDLRRALEPLVGREDAETVVAECDRVRRTQYVDRGSLRRSLPARDQLRGMLRRAYPERGEGLVRRLRSLLHPPGRIRAELTLHFDASGESQAVALFELWHLLHETAADLREEHFEPLDDLARVRSTRWGMDLGTREDVVADFGLAPLRAAFDSALSRTGRGEHRSCRRVAAMLARQARRGRSVTATVPWVWGLDEWKY